MPRHLGRCPSPDAYKKFHDAKHAEGNSIPVFTDVGVTQNPKYPK